MFSRGFITDLPCHLDNLQPYALSMDIIYNKCWSYLRSDDIGRNLQRVLYPLLLPFTSSVGGGGNSISYLWRVRHIQKGLNRHSSM